MCCLISMCLWFLQFSPTTLIALWSEKMLDIISIFLNLLRLDLWSKMLYIPENAPYALEKKMCSEFLWKILKISIRSIWYSVLLKALVSLLSFCFDDLFIGVSGVLKFHTIIVVLSIYSFISVVCLMYWGVPMLDA